MPEKNQLFKLRGSEFLPVENTPIIPGSYNYKPRPQLSSDGNYTYRAGERDSTGQCYEYFYSVSPNGTTTRLFQTKIGKYSLMIHKNRVTNRIFGLTNHVDYKKVLLERINGEFVTSPLWIEKSRYWGGLTPVFPSYSPELKAWVGLRNDSLWMLTDGDTQWRHVDRVKT